MYISRFFFKKIFFYKVYSLFKSKPVLMIIDMYQDLTS